MENRVHEQLLDAAPELRAYTYRKILHADLVEDRCDVLKSDPEGWQPGEGSLSGQLADFAASGEIHPDDVGRFTTFTRLEQLRAAPRTEGEAPSLLYRRRTGEGYRWNLLEVVPNQNGGEASSATLFVKDVSGVLQEGIERTRGKRDRQMAAILKCRYQMMTTVDLESGLCERIDLRYVYDEDKVLRGDYAAYIQNALDRFVLPEDSRQFRATLSLEHMRRTARAVRDYDEEICQYRLRGEPPRWLELHVLYSRQGDQMIINILGQDITAAKEQEAIRLRAMEDRSYMISSLSSLFFSTYYIDLHRDSFRAVTQQRKVGDVLGDEVNFTAAIQLYANHFIHPDDRAKYLEALDVVGLRQKLRWWKPYVAVEYRKLPDLPGAGLEACTWVRATVMLARSGHDDLPETAVYVARDITQEMNGEAGSAPDRNS